MDIEDDRDIFQNRINEENSDDNFFILDGIQAFQPSEATTPKDHGAGSESNSNNLPKENNFIQKNSKEVFCSPGLTMWPTAAQKNPSKNELDSDIIEKINSAQKLKKVIPVSNPLRKLRKEVLCFPGPVMTALQVHGTDRASSSNAKENSIQQSSKEVFCPPGLIMSSVNIAEKLNSAPKLNSFIRVNNPPEKPTQQVYCIADLPRLPVAIQSSSSKNESDVNISEKINCTPNNPATKPDQEVYCTPGLPKFRNVFQDHRMDGESSSNSRENSFQKSGKEMFRSAGLVMLPSGLQDCPSKNDSDSNITGKMISAPKANNVIIVSNPTQTPSQKMYCTPTLPKFQSVFQDHKMDTESNSNSRENAVQKSSKDVFCSAGLVMMPTGPQGNPSKNESDSNIGGKRNSAPKPNNVIIVSNPAKPNHKVYFPSSFAKFQSTFEDCRTDRESSSNTRENNIYKSSKEVFCSTGLVMLPTGLQDSPSKNESDSNTAEKTNSARKSDRVTPVCNPLRKLRKEMHCIPFRTMLPTIRQDSSSKNESDSTVDKKANSVPKPNTVIAVNNSVKTPTFPVGNPPSQNEQKEKLEPDASVKNGPPEQSSNVAKQLRSRESSSTKESDSEICVLQEKDPKEKSKNVIEHTIDDESDSEICIIKEQIQGPPRGKSFLKKRAIHLKCSDCSFKTTSISQLRVHEEAHPKGRKIKCSKCPFETRLKSCMIYHAAMHSGGKKFRCSKCSFRTDALDKFLSHESQKFSCVICEVTCHLRKELEQHMFDVHAITAKKLIFCQKCSFSALNKKDMVAHREVHRNVSRCQKCSFETRDKEVMEKHEMEHFGKRKKGFNCTKCKFSTSNKHHLREHLLKHAPEDIYTKRRGRPPKKTYTCPLCDYKTGNNNTMRVHRERKHILRNNSGTDEFQCLECDYVTDERLFFEKHSRTHSKKPDFNSSTEMEIFKCSFCDFETEFEGMMQSHLSTHSESDSDFDMDFEGSIMDDFQPPEDRVKDVLSSETKSNSDKKFRCESCDFQTDLEKRFDKHRSLHLRHKVFSIIFNPV